MVRQGRQSLGVDIRETMSSHANDFARQASVDFDPNGLSTCCRSKESPQNASQQCVACRWAFRDVRVAIPSGVLQSRLHGFLIFPLGIIGRLYVMSLSNTITDDSMLHG